MPATVRWYNEEKTILYYTFEGKLTWDDLYNSMQNSLELLDEVSHKVHSLIDVTKTTGTPSLNVGAMQKVIGGGVAKHENKGLSIIVGARPIVQAIFGIFERLYPSAMRGYQSAKTIEDALTLMHADTD